MNPFDRDAKRTPIRDEPEPPEREIGFFIPMRESEQPQAVSFSPRDAFGDAVPPDSVDPPAEDVQQAFADSALGASWSTPSGSQIVKDLRAACERIKQNSLGPAYTKEELAQIEAVNLRALDFRIATKLMGDRFHKSHDHPPPYSSHPYFSARLWDRLWEMGWEIVVSPNEWHNDICRVESWACCYRKAWPETLQGYRREFAPTREQAIARAAEKIIEAMEGQVSQARPSV